MVLAARLPQWRPPRPSVRFLDPALGRRFERDGFVVVDLLDDDGLAVLREVYAAVAASAATAGFHVTLDGHGYEENRRVSDRVVQALSPGLVRVIGDFDVVGATFLVKQVADDSSLPVHQDWSSVDERRHVAINIWTPLVDVDTTNGTLEVLPGSHRWFDAPRSPWYPSVELDLDGPVGRHLIPLTLRAGTTVIYDNRLFHGSRSNRSGRERAVAQLGVVSRGAQTVMATADEPGRVTLRPVDPAAFFAGTERPPGGPQLADAAGDDISHDIVAPTEADVLARCGRRPGVAGEVRRWLRRA